MPSKFCFRSLAPLLTIGQVLAWGPPDYSSADMYPIWVDEFDGSQGYLPNQNNWNVIQGNLGVNAELETYTDYPQNVQLSGGATVQLIPEYNENGIEWSSGRIESKYTFTPAAGKLTWAESCFNVGDNSQTDKQGIWPAFWLLGDSCRNGGTWPTCGELDIFEEVDGGYTGYGTVHTEQPQVQGSVALPDYSWHYWRLAFDRRSNDWTQETITWYLDSNEFFSINAASLNWDENAWNAICHSPLYFILNVAIGGTWPGYPNQVTWMGAGSMLEAAYVGVFQSS